jgi:hypothetical protein
MSKLFKNIKKCLQHMAVGLMYEELAKVINKKNPVNRLDGEHHDLDRAFRRITEKNHVVAAKKVQRSSLFTYLSEQSVFRRGCGLARTSPALQGGARK